MKKRPKKREESVPLERAILLGDDGFAFEVTVNYDLLLASRIAKRFEAEVDWIERLVSHAPTIGEHYEHILLSLLAERVGSNYAVGRGFIVDPTERKQSPQLDIIVHSHAESSPFFERGEFLIAHARNVTGVGEVKKTLTPSLLRDTVRKHLKLDLGTRKHWPHGVQKLHIFAVRANSSTKKLLYIIREEFGTLCKSLRNSDQFENAQQPLNSVCLPSIYFFDRPEAIETELVYRDGYQFALRSRIVNTHGASNSVGPFVSSIFPHSLPELSALETVVHNYEDEALSSETVGIFRRYGVADLASRFPLEKELLRKQEEEGRHNLYILTPAHIDVENYPTLRGFLTCRPHAWMSVAGNIQSSP